jgi:glycosyltransferase involved in cell wall biosynthesis
MDPGSLARGEDVAVLIPCYNEASSVGRVVRSFRQVLPEARIYVYDNNSTDGTAEAARSAGAVLRAEPTQGKGAVVRRMFADVEARAYLLVDGDGTYDASAAPEMLRRLAGEHLDMVAGARLAENTEAAYRSGHVAGNRLLSGMVRFIFGRGFEDMLTGYRAFSRRFVKSFPAVSRGFEIETEFAVHALTLGLSCAEIPTRYGARDEGSESKLSTWRDGFRILGTILRLLRNGRPLLFFFWIALLLGGGSCFLAVPVVAHWLRTGLVPRLPTALLSTGLMILAFLSLACGLVLDTVSQHHRELKRLAYLAVPNCPDIFRDGGGEPAPDPGSPGGDLSGR